MIEWIYSLQVLPTEDRKCHFLTLLHFIIKNYITWLKIISRLLSKQQATNKLELTVSCRASKDRCYIKISYIRDTFFEHRYLWSTLLKMQFQSSMWAASLQIIAGQYIMDSGSCYYISDVEKGSRSKYSTGNWTENVQHYWSLSWADILQALRHTASPISSCELSHQDKITWRSLVWKQNKPNHLLELFT